jgi:DNA-directed RNA polymerase subunit N
MIVPIRCFSCGKVVGEHYEEYLKRVQKGENPEKVLDDLGIKRSCCRRTIFSQADLIEKIMKYKV